MKIRGPGPAALWGMGSCRVVGHGFSRGKRRTVLISRPLQRASPGRLQPGVRQWDERLETGMWDADEAEARTGKPAETGWKGYEDARVATAEAVAYHTTRHLPPDWWPIISAGDGRRPIFMPFGLAPVEP